MLLAIDIGNSNITVGCIDDGSIIFEERLGTDLNKTELEYAMGIKMIFDLYDVNQKAVSGVILSSVVPPLTNVIKSAVRKIIDRNIMVVGPGIKSGLNLHMDDPRSVGADLVVEAVAAINKYGAPLIIVDMGTATSICVVDKDCNYIGGMIIPGVEISLEALSEKASQLPKISIEPSRKVIGRNTEDGMKSGIICGTAAMIDGLIDRVEEEIGCKTTVVAASNRISRIIVPVCKKEIILDNELILRGLDIIYHKNS